MAQNKDKQIVFQNQSKLIQEHFKNCGICPELIDICLGTDLMVRFATEGYSKELAGRFTAYEEYLQDKYKGKK